MLSSNSSLFLTKSLQITRFYGRKSEFRNVARHYVQMCVRSTFPRSYTGLLSESLVQPLPTLQELYLSRVSKRAGKITLDPSHPAHSLFELLPSGRRYRALSTRTTRHRNSFLPPSNPSHEHLTLTWNTQHYFTTIYSPHIHI